ncbi:FecR family protein [Pseudomonas yamanorum]|uniref:FecR family protein n=1 Tax=Pseudomonas yamanorum TaxID=515393 RepID=UPI0015A1C7E7|nr:FecR family protein [Pseudomonas yamanorum]NWD25627.1 FecR family protein [Pseudomonas yamanorum]
MNDQPTPSPSERDQQALDWFTRLRGENLTFQELNTFALWREDPLNAHAYQNAETLWQLLDRPSRAAHKPDRRQPISRRRTYATAACLILAAGAIWLGTPPISSWGSDYTTSTGQQQDITLADGSHLHLDSDSALDIDLTSDERRVNLRRGRVYLQVSHDSRPFIVQAGGTRVRALGTEFSVAHNDKSDEVILLLGMVEVAASGQHQTLQPGEQLRVVSGYVQAPQAVDAERLLAWRKGLLSVRDAPLREVLEELVRYQGGHVIWLDDKVGQRTINASFNLNQVDSALDALISTQKLRTTALTRRILIVRG